MAEHIPVLVESLVEALAFLGSVATVLDGTCGMGGHSRAILERYPGFRVGGLDRDPHACESATRNLRQYGSRATVRHGCFGDWLGGLEALGLERISGLILDLGVSSYQLDTPGRGFSFRSSGPLDMRMDPGRGESVKSFLAGAPEAEIARVIFEYGEERFSRRIAGGIARAIAADRLHTTEDLAAICRRAYPKGRHRIDPATRTFQALRIQVNDELGELKSALRQVPEGLSAPGIVAVISFHSLEDRIVKQTFRDWQSREGGGLGRILKPAPIVADETERAANPRARSAKLRVFRWGEEAPAKGDRYRSKHHR